MTVVLAILAATRASPVGLHSPPLVSLNPPPVMIQIVQLQVALGHYTQLYTHHILMDVGFHSAEHSKS